jgi:three-Cys-motif partner protein
LLEKLPNLEDDGLITEPVGPWAVYKYRLVWNYAKIFTTGMKSKWDELIYIDLFAGAGHSKIKDGSTIVPASPLLALDIANKFNKYIFCEQDSDKMSVLKIRVERQHSDSNVNFIEGDVTGNIDEIISVIPKHGPRHKVLSFCFIDPYKIDNFKFQSIEKLADKFMDFLILIPSFMDANRNVIQYAMETNMSIEDFTGVTDWRESWDKDERKGIKFGEFLPDLFGSKMSKLNYINKGHESTIMIRSHDKNLPLYHLAFFSKHETGMRFWQQARKYSSDQIDLF